MVVTELAVFRLKSEGGEGDLPKDIRAVLKQAKDVMEEYSSKTLYFAQQVEEPRFLYGLGDWVSIEAHHDALELTPYRLESFLDTVDIESLIHLDVSAESIQLDAPMLSITRFFVHNDQREDFSKYFATVKHILQGFLSEGVLAAGWKQEATDLTSEFVIFAPWKDINQHLTCAQHEDFQKISQLQRFTFSTETKHMKVLKT